MALEFINPTRSFDPVRNAVRFVGHDGMFQVGFIVEAAALAQIGHAALSEQDFLGAFDRSRASIHDAAREAYSKERRSSYTLTSDDLR